MQQLSDIRVGNFTSSEIYRLMATPKKANEYVLEKNFERKLKRSLSSEVNSKPINWGHLCEPFAFDLLDTSYLIESKKTLSHPEIPYWLGTPDVLKNCSSVVGDIKCPYTLKSFCQLVSCINENDLRKNHEQGEKYFWQLISNACVLGIEKVELIIYCPFESDLEEIKQIAINSGEPNYYFVTYSQGELPFLIEGSDFKNINILSFEAKKEYKKQLNNAVLKYGKDLISA
jgi:hypothetical protein